MPKCNKEKERVASEKDIRSYLVFVQARIRALYSLIEAYKAICGLLALHFCGHRQCGGPWVGRRGQFSAIPMLRPRSGVPARKRGRGGFA
jgi:hypothetical protein